MELEDMEATHCILNQIAEFEQHGADFEALRKALGSAGAAGFQFSRTLLEPCHGEATYVREAEGSRLATIHLKLAEATTLPQLAQQFGKFKHLPPSPARKWTALAHHAGPKDDIRYAIIAEADHKIDDETPITRVKIRIDYED
jgi:hypothetical protein